MRRRTESREAQNQDQDLDSAIDGLDGDALESRTPAPGTSRSGRQTRTSGTASAPRRSSGRLRESPPPEPSGSGFLLRLALGMLGAVALAAASAGLHQLEVRALWQEMLSGASFPPWQAYGLVAALVLGGSLVVGLIAALHDRSAWRVLWLGMAWAAVVQIGLAYHAREVVLLEPAAEDPVATGLAMTQAALAPGIAVARRSAADHRSEVEALGAELAAEREAAAGLQSSLDSSQTALASAQEAAGQAAEAAQAAAKDLQERLATTRQELTAMETRLTTTVTRLSALEDQYRESTGRIETLQADLQAAQELNTTLSAEHSRLQDEASNWRLKAETATRALEQGGADAKATKALSGKD